MQRRDGTEVGNTARSAVTIIFGEHQKYRDVEDEKNKQETKFANQKVQELEHRLMNAQRDRDDFEDQCESLEEKLQTIEEHQASVMESCDERLKEVVADRDRIAEMLEQEKQERAFLQDWNRESGATIAAHEKRLLQIPKLQAEITKTKKNHEIDYHRVVQSQHRRVSDMEHELKNCNRIDNQNRALEKKVKALQAEIKCLKKNANAREIQDLSDRFDRVNNERMRIRKEVDDKDLSIKKLEKRLELTQDKHEELCREYKNLFEDARRQNQEKQMRAAEAEG